MDVEREVENARYAQLGFVLKAYRRAFQDENGRTGISQEELLRRMGAVDDAVNERFSHATVSRWEAGTTRPTVERLRTIGKALDLSNTEVAGLILLAGLAPTVDAAETEAAGLQAAAVAPTREQAPDPQPAESTGRRDDIPPPERSVSLMAALRVMGLRFAVFVLFVVGVGQTFAGLGWDSTWMPVVYVCISIALVMAMAFIFPDRDANLRDFYWVSVFFVMAVPSLQFAPIKMDQFGFYAIGDIAGTHVPFMLCLLVSFATATLCALMFQLLRHWQESRRKPDDNPVVVAALTVLPPIAAAYALVLALSNVSIWIQSAVVMWMLACVFTGHLLLRDPTVSPSQSQRRFLLSATFTIAMVGTTVGFLTIIAIYVSPESPRVLPDHNLFVSWEIDFEERGLTRAEALDRLNLGYMSHATFLFIYLTFVVGGSLLTAVYRMAGGDSAGPDAVHAEVDAFAPTPSSAEVRSIPERRHVRRWPILAQTRK